MYSSSCSLRGLRLAWLLLVLGRPFAAGFVVACLGISSPRALTRPPLRRPGAGLVALTNRESLIRIEGDPPRITHGRYHAQSGTASSIALECLLVCHPAAAHCIFVPRHLHVVRHDRGRHDGAT